jgi:hypothetical protein
LNSIHLPTREPHEKLSYIGDTIESSMVRFISTTGTRHKMDMTGHNSEKC